MRIFKKSVGEGRSFSHKVYEVPLYDGAEFPKLILKLLFQRQKPLACSLPTSLTKSEIFGKCHCHVNSPCSISIYIMCFCVVFRQLQEIHQLEELQPQSEGDDRRWRMERGVQEVRHTKMPLWGSNANVLLFIVKRVVLDQF